ncbi:MAG: two-component system response regulator [Desulfatirhabdiaceae bacterium]
MSRTPVILIVDDEERNLRLMEAMLLPTGYQVVKASNGMDAIQIVKENPPDVILMDVMMPVINGIEATRQLKADEDTRMIPVVMITALREVEDRVRSLEAGADDFMSKPVDKIELRTRVRTLIQVKAYHDHLKDYQKKLEQDVQERTIQLQHALKMLKQSSLETIHCLSRAAEFKDEETGAHINRMSLYSAAVGRKMGLSETTIERILYAAPMHDVGKIGIPDRVLMKPGKLDPEEWEIIKQHTVIGAKILAGSSAGFIKLAQVIALTHHEKWDGSGYPKGLKGTRIPLAGRITAIADVFDALNSRRPYKEPFPIEKSFGIIRESRGRHFDPAVVDAFFDIEPEILAIREEYQDPVG